MKQEGIPKEDFENVKKALYGDYVCSFNSVERVANGLVQAHFSGVDIYDTVEVAARVTLEDVTRRLMQFDQNRCAISIVEPKA